MRCMYVVAFALIAVLRLSSASAETIVIAIEDKDWSPYYTWVDGQPQGPCPEIAAGAVRQMGADVEFVRYPWVRVLQSVERKIVDAGLCGTKSDERSAYSHYPDEPLLNYDATLFVRVGSPLQTSDISALRGKTVGAIKGYTYGGVDKELADGGVARIETNNRESLLKILILGRVDMVLDSILPTFADARELGLADKIRPLKPSLAETPGYLFFSKKPGHGALAARFSKALEAFKMTAEYRDIAQRYGL